MIKEFTEPFINAKSDIISLFNTKHPDSYDTLVEELIKFLENVPHKYDENIPDKDRITVIDHGDYQGTRLFIIGCQGYQPSKYWSIFVDYGSCSGCDTLEAITRYSSEAPTEKQKNEYYTLMLHMVQSMKELNDDNHNN